MDPSPAPARTWIAATALAAACGWAATGWLARGGGPGAAAWSDAAFALSVLLTCAACGTAYVLWSPVRRRRRCFRAAAVALGSLLAVAVLEVPAALGAVDWFAVWLRWGGDGDGPTTAFVADRSLSFRRPPNLHWTGRPPSDLAITWNLPVRAAAPQSFTTDSLGFRNPRELDRADVVLIGDSYVEGHWVSDEETCAAVLARETGLAVANLGIAGYGSLQQLEVLERHGLGLRPRLVAWFFFEGNDLYDDEAFENAMLHYRAPAGAADAGSATRARRGGSTWFRRSFVRQAFRALRRLCHPLVPVPVAASGWFGSGDAARRLYFHDYAALTFGEFERRRLAKAGAALLRARRQCEEAGAQLVVLCVPMKFRVYGSLCTFAPGSPCREWRPWQLPSLLAESCAAAHIPFVDLSEPMRAAAAAGGLLYAPEDSHWSAAGHEFVADVLAGLWQRIGR